MKFLESIKSVLRGASKKEKLDQLISLGFALQNAPTEKIAKDYFNKLKQKELTPATIFSEIEKIHQQGLLLPVN